jgi:hypothetical protein
MDSDKEDHSKSITKYIVDVGLWLILVLCGVGVIFISNYPFSNLA